MSYLEPCWAILSDLGGHLEFSEALLEPSKAVLDALTARGPPPVQGPGRGSRGGGRVGGGGRGNPLPEGEEEGWKRNLPKPLTP